MAGPVESFSSNLAPAKVKAVLEAWRNKDAQFILTDSTKKSTKARKIAKKQPKKTKSKRKTTGHRSSSSDESDSGSSNSSDSNGDDDSDDGMDNDSDDEHGKAACIDQQGRVEVDLSGKFKCTLLRAIVHNPDR